jgi:hypothetical protein
VIQAADVGMDADRLAFLVVDEIELRQPHEHRTVSRLMD